MSSTDIAFVTLGCAKNEVDTDKMATRLIRAGFTIVDDPAAASLVIVNTCSFLVSAVSEGLDVIFDLLEQQANAPVHGKLLVAGCMPARYGEELADELPEAAGFLSAADEEHIVEKVEQLLGIVPESTPAHLAAYAGQTRSHGGPSAYVKISDGCDRFCTYCMIPYIRGRYRDFTAEDILREVGELVESGTREIVFIGQDTGIWGHTLPGEPTITDLLAEAARKFPETWFRLLYVQPAGITDDLLELMASTPNICSYLDMPLQHCDADVLERMHRSGSPKEYLELVAHVRELVPDIVVRTTFMCGFPGETDEQSEELLDFADEAQFDLAVVFPYSQEDGSEAAAYPDQVDEDARLERAQRLLDACEVIGYARTERHIGKTVAALVEGYEQTDVGLEALCRWQGQAPDVDGQVHVPLSSENDVAIGDIVDATIVDSFCYDLIGELV